MALNNNAININAGFEIGSAQPIDSRQLLTKAQMLSIDDNIMPSKYFCICKDDGALYTYNSINDEDVETGKFRKVEGTESTQLQYKNMPPITEDTMYLVIQYIGNSNLYEKGGWYGTNEIDLYEWSDGINKVYTTSNTPAINDDVFDNNYLKVSTVKLYDDTNTAIVDKDDNTYTLTEIKTVAYWDLLSSKNAIEGDNYSNGKIWKGSKEEYENLSEDKKENENITFHIYEDEDSYSIINDNEIANDKTLSSAKMLSTFVTEQTTGLENYYKKDDTFSKAEILAITSKNLKTEIVEELPVSNISETVVYLLKNGDFYDQYMYINEAWVKIGTTNIDLSEYATKEYVDGELKELNNLKATWIAESSGSIDYIDTFNVESNTTADWSIVNGKISYTKS